MPFNVPKKHWFVAQFEIRTGVVTFYNSGVTFAHETRDWYLLMRACLEVISTLKYPLNCVCSHTQLCVCLFVLRCV